MPEDKLKTQEGVDKSKDLERNVLVEPIGEGVVVEKEISPEEAREKERITEKRKEAIRKTVEEKEVGEEQRETIDEIKKEARKSGTWEVFNDDQIVERLILAIKDDDNRHNLENALQAAREMGESVFDNLIGELAGNDEVWEILKEKGYIDYPE
ncbi:MAG: hypothetical protein WC242_00275 [Candidatus Paceibacterota bacterium]|jgi:hypothetical protein